MVDRYAIRPRDPVTVVDLDGTLVKGNTLSIYVMCGLRYLLRKGRIGSFVKLVSVILRRRMRLISHAEMKTIVLSDLYPYDDILESFKRKVMSKINPDVAAVIECDRMRRHLILLATAAPDFYVREIWDGNFVATCFKPGEEMIECRGEEKLRRVEQWVDKQYGEIDIVLSDHFDDAPLFEANIYGQNILVNPDRQTLRFFRELKPTQFLLIEEI